MHASIGTLFFCPLLFIRPSFPPEEGRHLTHFHQTSKLTYTQTYIMPLLFFNIRPVCTTVHSSYYVVLYCIGFFKFLHIVHSNPNTPPIPFSLQFRALRTFVDQAVFHVTFPRTKSTLEFEIIVAKQLIKFKPCISYFHDSTQMFLSHSLLHPLFQCK